MAPVGSPFGSCILGFPGVREPSLWGQSAPWREKPELQGSCPQHLLSEFSSNSCTLTKEREPSNHLPRSVDLVHPEAPFPGHRGVCPLFGYCHLYC